MSRESEEHRRTVVSAVGWRRASVAGVFGAGAAVYAILQHDWAYVGILALGLGIVAIIDLRALRDLVNRRSGSSGAAQ